MIKILLECDQEIPDFLEDQKPADSEPLVFDDDSGADDDEEEGAADAADAWGSGGEAAYGDGDGDGDGGDAWGSENPTTAAALVVEKNNWDAGNNKGGW